MSSRAFKILLGVALAGILAAAGVSAFLPRTAEAGPCGPCEGPVRNVMGWGAATTCAQAESNAQIDALIKAFNSPPDCFPCNQSYVITAPCWTRADGLKQVDLKLYYQCKSCDIGPIEPQPFP